MINENSNNTIYGINLRIGIMPIHCVSIEQVDDIIFINQSACSKSKNEANTS